MLRKLEILGWPYTKSTVQNIINLYCTVVETVLCNHVCFIRLIW